MKTAFVFPGQGAQFPGMGQQLYEDFPLGRDLFEQANDLLGFRITDVMFSGTAEDLKQTRVTQPAVFLHSVILAALLGDRFRPDMAAGHSLGEFSALTAAGALSFEDGLRLVSARAVAMQKACEMQPSTMAVVLGLPDETVENVCQEITGVVPANYNCPGQLVISGTEAAVDEACIRLKEAGAKRAMRLQVGGAFHSPLMLPAREELEEAIDRTAFNWPRCPIYQNVDAQPTQDPDLIKRNLKAQLTAPVRWTQSVRNMVQDGAMQFTELGPGKVLQGLIQKIAPETTVSGFNNIEI
ncbi:MAG: ACP S-malonyltransferase [Bacteroidales bacterium]|nr:ACP S-malonyltransferase [Bacteroidales bacterium]MBQ7213623.1 ACP S-malonyltransferase [Bacteroidales bacterium]MBR3288045.1 ACP S-malonyltransferase [Bacteroidales bacterium]MCR5714918.1 ACP S-malonyltransferase [Bacteroidales bacterium]